MHAACCIRGGQCLRGEGAPSGWGSKAPLGQRRLPTHPVAVVGDLEGLVGVDVDVFVVLGLLWGRPHEAPHRQVVDEQLVPGRPRGTTAAPPPEQYRIGGIHVYALRA